MVTHDNPFWEYSLAIYQRGKAQHYCIELQEQWQANVSMVLLMLFMAEKHIAFDASWIKEVEDLLTWSDKTIAVVRQARKFNKPGVQPFTDQSYYQHLLNTELLGENILQHHLYAFYRKHVDQGQNELAVWQLMVLNLKAYFSTLDADLEKLIVLVKPFIRDVAQVENDVLLSFLESEFKA